MAAYDFILPLKHVFRNTLPLRDVGLSDSFSCLMLTAADKVHRPLLIRVGSRSHRKQTALQRPAECGYCVHTCTTEPH